MENSPFSPFARPFYVMAKPAGARCNLRCDYCYYLEKARLYDGETALTMDDATLRCFVSQYIGAQTMRDVLFTWHGGEPLLRPLSFYLRAVELQREYAGDHHIDNCLQTNGTLLNAEWCRFLHDNHWLVGLSIDGTQAMHDTYRRTPSGEPTWTRVMRAVELLEQYGVEWNAMAVVHDGNVGRPVEFYRFFRQMGCRFLQFTPLVEAGNPHSISPEAWGAFLCSLFDEWVKADVGEVFVQVFDATLANWCGVAPGVCSLAATCGQAAAMEWNGDVYSCDHFVTPAHRLGNIHEHTLLEMMHSHKQAVFGRNKSALLPGECRRCRWLFACHGECPKNRLATSADGEPGMNVLCKGYARFFSHVAPAMDFMRGELEAGRAPAGVMRWWKAQSS